jgi:DUF4097 and DUF4098 domain-containing protein YvlB
MRKTTWIQWLALILVASPCAFADEWNKSFTVSAKADIRVDVTDGEVTVRAWDRNEINARVSTVGWTIGPSEVRVTEHQVGDRVEIDVRTPRMNISFGRHSVHVEVEVPRELRAEIHTGDGKISGHGLKGDIHLSTGDGSIEVDSMEGIFQAKTGDGHIRAGGRWDRLDLETNDGSVEVDVQAGSKMSGLWRVRSGDGRITLRIPENFAADLDAHTGDGKITVELPVMASGSIGTSEIRGKLNGGGEKLLLRTGDGAIRIVRL